MSGWIRREDELPVPSMVGTHCALLLSTGNVIAGRWSEAVGVEGVQGVWIDQDQMRWFHAVTHWVVLPELPS